MRKPRILEKNAKYHIVSKIHRNEHIFESDDFKNMLMDFIRKAKKKYKFLLEHFVIMENHIHLIIKPLYNENLSEIMKWILSNFAKKFNKIHNYKGQVWRDRFWSRIIYDLNQFIETFNYISNNPVKAKMIKNAEDYRFGGLYFILKKIFDIVDPPEY